MLTREAESAGWTKVLAGDRSEFWRLVNPLLEELREAAQRERDYLVAVGDLHSDRVVPDELVHEVLARAWEDRHRKPDDLEVKAWLLGLMYRLLDRLVSERQQEPLSEMHLPEDADDIRDVIPDPRPTPEEIVLALEEQPQLLDRVSRRVLMLHDFHGMSQRHTGAVVGKSVRETTAILAEARRLVRAHVSR